MLIRIENVSSVIRTIRRDTRDLFTVGRQCALLKVLGYGDVAGRLERAATELPENRPAFDYEEDIRRSNDTLSKAESSRAAIEWKESSRRHFDEVRAEVRRVADRFEAFCTKEAA